MQWGLHLKKSRVLKSLWLKTSLFLAVCVAVFNVSSASPKTLRIAAPTSISTSSDPFARHTGGAIKSAVFDGLTALSNKGELEPTIANEWEMVSETEWVFRLRPDVLFHNGQTVTAEHIAKQLQYLIKDEAQHHWMAQRYKSIVSINAIDPFTLSIVTQKPDPLIPRKMSLLRVVDMDYWFEVGEQAFAEQPVATGPYRLDSWGINRISATLVAVDHAWRNSKDVTQIQYNVVSDGARRMQTLMFGEMDIAINLDIDGIAPLEESGYKVALIELPFVLAIDFRTIDNPNAFVQDSRVRRALNYAVNKTQISKYILNDVMAVASQGTTPGVVGYNDDIEPFLYDKEKARALLAVAGYADGFDLNMAVTTGQVPGDALVFQQVAQDLQRVGVRVELQQLPFLELNRRLSTGDWDNVDAISTVWSSLNLYDVG